MSAVDVRHEPALHRYLAFRDGDQVGLVDYRREGEVFVVLHTETDPQHQGQGIAGDLTSAVLDDIRAQGARVRPVCPYTVAFVRRHPEYADLQAPTP